MVERASFWPGDDVIGLAWTLFSAVRSSKMLMYGLAALAFAGVALLALSRFGARREKEGAMKVAAAAAGAVIQNMERYREIHAEVKRLPLSDRAARLRGSDRSQG